MAHKLWDFIWREVSRKEEIFLLKLFEDRTDKKKSNLKLSDIQLQTNRIFFEMSVKYKSVTYTISRL